MELRREQLRVAKRRQRAKERQAGFGLYQVKLAVQYRDRLKAGMQDERFIQDFCGFLKHEIVSIDEYPNLALLCWNQDVLYMTRREAFDLYERNWRLVDDASLEDHERGFIDELVREFGQGVINA